MFDFVKQAGRAQFLNIANSSARRVAIVGMNDVQYWLIDQIFGTRCAPEMLSRSIYINNLAFTEDYDGFGRKFHQPAIAFFTLF